ncbi:MAG TPA: hypothetical protein VIF15_07375 [Polyangiaceae bacterium]|jgi:hypothetical protein
MRVSSLPLLALLALLPAAVGCAGTLSGPEAGDAEATTTSAVVVVERTADATEGARAEASARFIRVAAPSSPADALRAIGASFDLPARGTCATMAALTGAAPSAQAPVVELVDVGAVSLEADGVETRLAPRQLPDVTDVVSGVVYARATDPALLPAATRYTVHVAGGHGLDGFDVSASAAGDPGEVRLGGEDAHGTLVATGSSFDLTWAADGSDDLVYVDVRPSGVRCVLDGAGHGALSTLLLDDAGTLVVHRLHREPLRARGVDSGEIRFDFARAVAYTRR